MSEKVLEINSINPLDLYGANNKKLTLIKQFFPKLKIIARGNQQTYWRRRCYSPL